ncbi:MAG: hypothetical protein ACRC6X_06720 [Culicoidibacterales bacterium]
MVTINKRNGDSIQIEQVVYDGIVKAILAFEVKDKWVSYAKLFSTIKPNLVADVGNAVWFVAPVLEQLVIDGLVKEKVDEDRVSYFISGKEH